MLDECGLGTLGDVGYLDDDGYLFMSDRRIEIIISGGVNVSPAEIEGVLVAHCREHLAGCKVPRRMEVLDKLPRQPTGKLYERLLRDPHREGTGRTI